MSDTLLDLMRDADYPIQLQVGDYIQEKHRAGEKIRRFAKKKMREPFVRMAEDEEPMSMKDAIYEAKTDAGVDSLVGADGRLTLPARNLKRAVGRGLVNRFGSPLVQDGVVIDRERYG